VDSSFERLRVLRVFNVPLGSWVEKYLLYDATRRNLGRIKVFFKSGTFHCLITRFIKEKECGSDV